MTPGPGIDMDLLADYVGGALDGTPEAATVERLVADDPGWARAYARLSEAVQAVQADLHGYGTRPEPMPAEVAARIDSALTPVPAKVVALEPRRRWQRRAAPVAVAAGLLIVVGLGATYLQQQSGEQDSAGSATSAKDNSEPSSAAGSTFSQQQREGVAPAAPQPLSTGALKVMASGTDYRPDTVKTFGLLPAETDQQRALTGAPEQLRRFAGRAVLNGCLDAIKKEHGQEAATVPVVDLARYEGSPAVVVRLAGAGGGWVWVSGPECGPAGADTLVKTPTE